MRTQLMSNITTCVKTHTSSYYVYHERSSLLTLALLTQAPERLTCQILSSFFKITFQSSIG